jgi:succinate dehydrogenase / fumarate reductase, membrane anchor subunit
MATPEKIGAKRLVVGAHYGIGDFMIQRITAIILAVYSIILLIGILMMPGFTYEAWRNVFMFKLGGLPLGQVLATLAFFALCWHAWIGVRDIWMDYVNPVGVRLLLQVLTVLWLIGSAVYFVTIIWGA